MRLPQNNDDLCCLLVAGEEHGEGEAVGGEDLGPERSPQLRRSPHSSRGDSTHQVMTGIV